MTKKESKIEILVKGNLREVLKPAQEERSRMIDLFEWEKYSNKKYFVLGEPSHLYGP